MSVQYRQFHTVLFLFIFAVLGGCAGSPNATQIELESMKAQVAIDKDQKKAESEAAKSLSQLRYQELIDSASEFLSSLSSMQQHELLMSYDDPSRKGGFCYVLDHCKTEHLGLRMLDLTGHQKRLMNDFLMKALSSSGYHKAMLVMNREWLLQEMEDAHRAMPQRYPVIGADGGTWVPPEQRGAPRYYIAFFGTPSPVSPWAVRFEGHHLSVNLGFHNESAAPLVSIMPMFLGSSPMIVPTAPQEQNPAYQTWQQQEGQQILAREAWLARSFLRQIDRRTRAKGQWYHLPGATLDGGTDVPLDVSRYDQHANGGINIQDLSLFELAPLEQFVNEFFDLLPEHSRPAARADFFDEGRVWWFGDWERQDQPFYFRVQTQRYLIEFLQSDHYSVKSEVPANHVHAVIRDLQQDWDYNPLHHHLELEH